MNPKLRKTLLAGAIASLLTSPMWATGETPDYPRERMGPQSEQQWGTTPPMGAGPAEMAPGAAPHANPLYDRTPEELNGLDVVDSAGEKVGKIQGVVLEPRRQSVHAVVSSGGILGIGAKKFVVSLDEVHVLGDDLQVTTSWEDVKARGEYDQDLYAELQKDRPISESVPLAPFEETEPAARPEEAGPEPQPEEADTEGESEEADPEGESEENEPSSEPRTGQDY